MLEELKWEEECLCPNCEVKWSKIRTPCPYKKDDVRRIVVGGLDCRDYCIYNHNKAYGRAQIVKCGFRDKIVNEDKVKERMKGG